MGLVVPTGTIVENRVPLRGVPFGSLGVADAFLPVGAQLSNAVRELVGAGDLDQLGLGLVVAVDYVDKSNCQLMSTAILQVAGLVDG